MAFIKHLFVFSARSVNKYVCLLSSIPRISYEKWKANTYTWSLHCLHSPELALEEGGRGKGWDFRRASLLPWIVSLVHETLNVDRTIHFYPGKKNGKDHLPVRNFLLWVFEFSHCRDFIFMLAFTAELFIKKKKTKLSFRTLTCNTSSSTLSDTPHFPKTLGNNPNLLGIW